MLKEPKQTAVGTQKSWVIFAEGTHTICSLLFALAFFNFSVKSLNYAYTYFLDREVTEIAYLCEMNNKKCTFNTTPY